MVFWGKFNLAMANRPNICTDNVDRRYDRFDEKEN
jgi:hypothetical protein